MKRILMYLFLLSAFFINAQNIKYVAPPDHLETPGNDFTGNGSFEKPWASFQKAIDEAVPGDTVYFRGGIYYSTRVNSIDPLGFGDNQHGVSGTSEYPIRYAGYPPDVASGSMPILDCIYHCDSIPKSPYGPTYNSAISITNAEFIILKDLEIRNVFQCDSVITGAIGASTSANLTFDHIVMHDIGQRGYWIVGGAWGQFTRDPVPLWEYDTTRWINCDVYNLFDTLAFTPGNAADAWKTIHYKGNYLLWEGCRAWNYSDDGWDPTPVNGAERVFNNCWAMASNKYEGADLGWDTERNGFKLNSHDPQSEQWDVHSIIMTNCIALFCNSGFYEIGGTPPNGIYYNNTSFKNSIGFGGLSISNSIYRNNIVYGSTAVSATGKPYECSLPSVNVLESHNSWDKTKDYPWFKYTDSVTVSNEDFVVTDSLTLVSLFTAPRQTDGSLPEIHPLRLAANSDLIDAGTIIPKSDGANLSIEYKGTNPDLGAFEFGSVSVELISPSNGSVFTQGDVIKFIAEATSNGGAITSVEFFIEEENLKIGDGDKKSGDQWEFTWEGAWIDNHYIRAVAINDLGESATSARVSVVVKLENSIDPKEYVRNCYIVPNPNDGIFRLLLPDHMEVTSNIYLVTIDGKVKYTTKIFEKEQVKDFNISHLSPGLYNLQFSNEDDYQPCGSNGIKILKN